MKTQGAHAHEDRLLDFAYGELPPTEAQIVEQHVHGCSRCSEALDGIRGVRASMSRLPLEPASDAGLESLLAYAQQSARRAAAGPEPAPRWWRRLLAPALGVAALSVFGVVVVQVNREVDLSPAALTLKQEAPREKAPGRGAKPVMAEAAPASAEPVPMPVPATAPVPADIGKVHAQMDEEIRAAVPTKPMPKAPSKKGIRLREDWSNIGAGSAGGFPDKNVAYSDDEAGASEGMATKESKSKRDAIGGKSLPAVSTASRAEPASDALAGADLAAEYGSPAEPQVAQSAPPEPQQTVRGSASRPSASMASKDSAEDDAYAQGAPGRAQAANAAPPPPPAAQYQPAPATSGPVARAEKPESKKSEAEQMSTERPVQRRTLSAAELMKQADVANRSGDWAQEVTFLRAALSAGVRGSQQVEVLSRLCEAEFALGRRQIAIGVCREVVAVAPGSSAARKAQSLLDDEFQSPAGEADSDAKDASPAKK
ncbi:zf-HC2 domain-containing protein [Archangium lansingense]|uniref:Zf-HC2 domain-containing protein n=1 Tax=Archangium lansingense TaxID=2995310 RepID=A0ABT4AEB1_9BACT|nr:zf-HC2 domain-containing protein [Archangium lansinium]MCY1079656.1 zf-HC2 domain-containing protein [Archangium lansinium]